MGGGNAGIDVMEEAKEERDDSIPWLPGDAINELREVGCYIVAMTLYNLLWHDK